MFHGDKIEETAENEIKPQEKSV